MGQFLRDGKNGHFMSYSHKEDFLSDQISSNRFNFAFDLGLLGLWDPIFLFSAYFGSYSLFSGEKHLEEMDHGFV